MIIHKLSQLTGPTGLSALRLEGTARFGAAPLSAVYLGNGSNLEFLSGLFFEQPARQTLEPRLHPLALRRVLRRVAAHADLALYEVPPLWVATLPRAATIRFPAWLRQEIRLPHGPEARRRWLLPRDVERETQRLIRRHGYVIDFTTAEDFKRLFFQQFYRPYITSRFGPGATIAAEGEFMERCRSQTLARLHAGPRWVAGLLFQQRGRTVRFGRFGAADDPPAPGASEVLDTLVIHHARDLGVRRIVTGDSRPCLADGVLRYKAKFGAHLTSTLLPQPVLGIEVRRWSPAVRECLERQPLLVMRGNTPHAYRLDDSVAEHRMRAVPLLPANA
jgi:hypothetical protein